MTKDVYDVIILGAGPAGLFTAFYGGLRGAKVKIIESLPNIGGQLTALYPEKYIYDVAGIPKIRAKDLIDNLKEQISRFDIPIELNEEIVSVEKIMEEDIFRLLSKNCNEHYAKTIIITAGNGAFQPRKLNVENAEKFEKTNLYYYVKEMNVFKNKRVVLLGGGDSAVDWALMLEPIAKEITLVHRRDTFRAHEESVNQLKKSRVNILTPYIVKELKGEDRIERVVFEEIGGNNIIEMETDAVLCNYGFISRLGPINNWGLQIEKNSIVVNTKMETNIKGIYAAGDINTFPGKVKLIATGFGEGPTAINNAFKYINPDARLQPIHSTSLFSI